MASLVAWGCATATAAWARGRRAAILAAVLLGVYSLVAVTLASWVGPFLPLFERIGNLNRQFDRGPTRPRRRRHADMAVTTITKYYPESAMAHLGFEAALADRLELPVGSRLPPALRRSGGVWNEAVEAAAQEAEAAAADPPRIEAFMRSWPPGRRFERFHEALAHDWAQLPCVRMPAVDASELTCTFTSETGLQLSMPVVLRCGTESYAVFDYRDFVRYWIEKGNNPVTTNPVELGELRRLEIV